MKKKILKLSLAIIGLIAVLFIYFNSTSFIKNNEWKYSEGTYVGDWLNKSNIIIKDGIIYGNQWKAKISFCFGFKLFIKNMDTGEVGIYTNKS